MRETEKQSGIYAVAAEAGVSVMSVSRAMRGVDGISSKKRDEILAIARRLNYVPNSNARALSQANADLVGISLPTFANDVFADVLEGTRGTIRRAGFTTVIDTTEYDLDAERRWVERLLSWRPAGLILTGVDHHPDVRGMLRDAKVPTLETWDYDPDPIDVVVGIDHVAAGRELAAEIQRLGYEKPAFIGVARGHDARADKRLKGLRDVFDVPIARIATKPANSFRMGSEAMHQLLEDHTPDVVFFLNDHMAFGGLIAAQASGLSVPDDIGIVGFNALDLNTVLPIPLTTMQTPRRIMGVTGARKLLARFNGLDGERAVALPVTFVPGATTRLQKQR